MNNYDNELLDQQDTPAERDSFYGDSLGSIFTNLFNNPDVTIGGPAPEQKPLARPQALPVEGRGEGGAIERNAPNMHSQLEGERQAAQQYSVGDRLPGGAVVERNGPAVSPQGTGRAFGSTPVQFNWQGQIRPEGQTFSERGTFDENGRAVYREQESINRQANTERAAQPTGPSAEDQARRNEEARTGGRMERVAQSLRDAGIPEQALDRYGETKAATAREVVREGGQMAKDNTGRDVARFEDGWFVRTDNNSVWHQKEDGAWEAYHPGRPADSDLAREDIPDNVRAAFVYAGQPDRDSAVQVQAETGNINIDLNGNIWNDRGDLYSPLGNPGANITDPAFFGQQAVDTLNQITVMRMQADDALRNTTE